MTATHDLMTQITEMQKALASMKLLVEDLGKKDAKKAAKKAAKRSLPASDSENEKTTNTESSKKDEEPKIKRAPNAIAKMLKEISPTIKKILNGKKASGSIHMLKIVGRLRSTGIEDPTEEQISEAIAFLESNPDHMSKAQKTLSAKNSVSGDEKPKKRRGKKAKEAVLGVESE
jgi:hypothetical protein